MACGPSIDPHVSAGRPLLGAEMGRSAALAAGRAARASQPVPRHTCMALALFLLASRAALLQRPAGSASASAAAVRLSAAVPPAGASLSSIFLAVALALASPADAAMPMPPAVQEPRKDHATVAVRICTSRPALQPKPAQL